MIGMVRRAIAGSVGPCIVLVGVVPVVVIVAGIVRASGTISRVVTRTSTGIADYTDLRSIGAISLVLAVVVVTLEGRTARIRSTEVRTGS